MAIYELEGTKPEFPADGLYWVAETAAIIGKVRLHTNVSIWYGSVLRGDNEWIEMRLRARSALTVKIPELDLVVPFEEGEELRTEVSAKFRQDGVRAELAGAGMDLTHWWTDGEGRFALSLATAS